MDRRRLTVIFIIVFVDVLGFGLILPLLPYYATELGASPTVIGALVASYALAQVIGVPILGRASDIYGRRPILILSIIGTTVGFLILGFASSLWMLFLGRIVDGLTGANFTVAQSYISDVTTAKDRARGLGLTGAAFGLGFIVGPALGGALSEISYSTPAFVAAAVALTNIVLVLVFLPETLTPERKAELAEQPRSGFTLRRLRQALRKPLFGQVITIRFFFWFAFAIFQGTFTQWGLLALDLTPQINGYVLGYVGVISVLVQATLIGPLTRRFPEVRLVLWALVATAICLPLWGASSSLAMLLAVLAPLGVAVAIENTVVSSLISKSVTPDEIGGAFGLSGGLQSAGSIAAPVIGGILLQQVGTWAPGLLAGLIVAGLIPYAYTRLTRPVQDGRFRFVEGQGVQTG
jgi:DHA1 family tetracycline resistance protein-like MFS transporter